MLRSSSQSATLDAAHRRVWPILLGAFAASPFIYMGIGWFLRRDQSVTPVLPDGLHFALLGVAGAAFVAALVWTRLGLSGSATPGDAATPHVSPMKFQTAMIVACAMAEIPAILGLVLAIMGAPLSHLYLLGGSSVALIGGSIVPAVLRYLTTLRADGPVSPGS